MNLIFFFLQLFSPGKLKLKLFFLRTIDNVSLYESQHTRMNIIKGETKKIIYMVSIYSLKGLSF